MLHHNEPFRGRAAQTGLAAAPDGPVAIVGKPSLTRPVSGTSPLARGADFLSPDRRRLAARLGGAAAKAPAGTAPAWLIRLVAPFSPAVREIVPQLNVIRRPGNARARSELDPSPRSDEDAVTATGESLIRLELADQDQAPLAVTPQAPSAPGNRASARRSQPPCLPARSGRSAGRGIRRPGGR